MRANLKVVFDWDGVFNRQVPFLCSRFSMPVPNRYKVKQATNITDAQAKRLIQAYLSDEGYLGVPLDEAFERALNLSCSPYVYSANTTRGMLEYKYSTIQRIKPDFPENHIVLPLGLQKPPILDADVVVEDGVHYLEQYPSTTIKLLIDYPYNREAPADIIRVSSLAEACDLIETL